MNEASAPLDDDAHASSEGHRLTFDLTLDDADAVEPLLVGGKAAALARARRAGITTLPGVVLTTRFSAAIDAGADLDVDGALASAFVDAQELVDRPGASLIVRSSSVVEDQSEESAAGQFTSVAGVVTADQFRDAVEAVLRSRTAAGAEGEQIGVLVQPQVEPELAGVVFGIEPVTGRTDQVLIAAVRGRPDRLVGGEVEGTTYVTDRAGSVVESQVRDGVELDHTTVRELVDVTARLADAFDAPQDVEWAMIGGSLVVLQSRPVTTPIRGVPVGPLYGPGVVAETFPDPLSELEQDLWVTPLDDAVRAALTLAGRHTDDELADRRLVIAVDGRVAIDLEATGEHGSTEHRRSWIERRVRRLRNAWRLGRLRAALPSLVDDLLDRADADLADIPPLEQLSTRRAIALLHRSRAVLRSLHAHEILIGALSARPPESSSQSSLTSAAVALRVLHEGRLDGLADGAIVERAPVVLALGPPRIGSSTRLPRDLHVPAWNRPPREADEHQVRREALRLRARWVHEVTARLAWALGERLARRGELPDADAVRHLPLDELDAILTRRASAWWVALETARSAAPSEPLPSEFRLSDRGVPIPEQRGAGGSIGVSPGVAVGVVTHVDGRPGQEDDVRAPGEPSILVVRALSPDLAGRLDSVAGIVSETGSALSHLAILARERRVPVVVGHRDAVDRLRPGAPVRIDGSDGTVESLEPDRPGEHAEGRSP